MAGLYEGFVTGAANGIRRWFARSPEIQRMEIQRGGSPSVERAGLPFNLVSQYGYDSLAEHLRIDQDLQARFTDYEEMDEYGEISTALDIYADDSAMFDMERGQTIWIESENNQVEDELNDVLHQRLLIEDDIWGLCRTLSKYGNAYGELLVNETGLIGINFLPPATVRRVEGPRGELLGFVQDVRGEFNLSMDDFYKLAKQRETVNRPPGELTVFEDWELVHWRLRGKHLRSVYGHGVIDPARWIWKRLSLLEDALLIYKLSRAPARYAFYVDIGEYDLERGLAYVNKVKNEFVKRKFVNPNTGKLDMRHNPLAHDEDFFIPSKGGKDSTRIEVLQGPDYAETDTVEYHRDKLVSATKVPKAYMGYGGEEAKAALSTSDIRFARTVMRIQRSARGGIRQGCRVHMIARGMDVNRYEYEVKMSVPSAILELAKLEVMSATADLGERTREYLPMSWVLTNLFHMSEQEAEKLMDLKDKETVRKAKIDAQVTKMMAKAEAEGQPVEGGTQVQVPGGGDEEDQGDQGDQTGAPPKRSPFDKNAEDEQDQQDQQDQENGKPAKPGKPKPPKKKQEITRVPRGELLMMERRLKRMLEEQHKRMERSFEAKVRDSSRLERKVQDVLRSDQRRSAQMNEVRKLVEEVRSSL